MCWLMGPDMAVSQESLPELDKYRGRCLQSTIGLSAGFQMEELEKRLKELRGFAALWGEQQCQQSRPAEHLGTRPPVKEYTWRDQWLWPHIWQSMALLDISGVALGPEGVRCPSVGECQCGKAGVGG